MTITFDKEYSQYWQTVIQTMLDGLMIVDPDGIILSINSAFERISGYSKDELIGQSCEVLDCDTCFGARARGGDKHCALFKNGKVRQRKCVLRRKTGNPFMRLRMPPFSKIRTAWSWAVWRP